MSSSVGLVRALIALSAMPFVVGCATGTAHSNDSSAAPAALPAVLAVAQTKEDVRQSIGSQQKALRQCYYDAIDQLPGSEGKLTLSWEIRPSGEPANVSVTQADEKIKHASPCVIGVIEKVRFTPPKTSEAAVVIQYPLYFSENGKTRFE